MKNILHFFDLFEKKKQEKMNEAGKNAFLSF